MVDAALIPTGNRPAANEGVRIKDRRPSAPWEYRINDYGGGVIYASLHCIGHDCTALVHVRLDASGQNSIGSMVCLGCGKKAYARVDGLWLEVG